VKVLNVVEKSDVEHIITDKYHASQEVENELLQDYLKNANIPYQPNEDGIFIHKKQEGTGNVPRTTDYVTMHYTVTLIDGTFIETTLNKQPFTFRLGTNSVITGLEKAVLKMKTGEKSIVIIPSEYAYGAIETNNILPFSTLIFDVEILKIQ
jgi:FKBP-type peptidyl-prolyl cis-trans isomerase